MANEEDVVGAGNGADYAQVGGKRKRKSKSSKRRKTGALKMKKNKSMKRKTAKTLKKRRR